MAVKKRRRGAREDKNVSVNGSASSSKGVPKCMLPEGIGSWHEMSSVIKGMEWSIYSSDDGSGASAADGAAPSAEMIKEFRSAADAEYAKELSKFEKYSRENASTDSTWVEKTAFSASSTLSDRISSSVILIQQNPVYRLRVMDDLLKLAGKEKRIATMVGDGLKDLMVSNLLPPDRKLLSFDSRPLAKFSDGTLKMSPKVLIMWRFEEMLKERYARFLSLIGSWMDDTLDTTKKFALHTSCELLTAAPEQEEVLLSMVVNKLGDPSKKAAASSGHQLRRVLEKHPAMTQVVCREVQQLSHRPNLSARGVYNCITFLNQIKFCKGEEELPRSLVSTYFKLFELATGADAATRPDKDKERTGKVGVGGGAGVRACLRNWTLFFSRGTSHSSFALLNARLLTQNQYTI